MKRTILSVLIASLLLPVGGQLMAYQPYGQQPTTWSKIGSAFKTAGSATYATGKFAGKLALCTAAIGVTCYGLNWLWHKSSSVASNTKRNLDAMVAVRNMEVVEQAQTAKTPLLNLPQDLINVAGENSPKLVSILKPYRNARNVLDAREAVVAAFKDATGTVRAGWTSEFVQQAMHQSRQQQVFFHKQMQLLAPSCENLISEGTYQTAGNALAVDPEELGHMNAHNSHLINVVRLSNFYAQLSNQVPAVDVVAQPLRAWYNPMRWWHATPEVKPSQNACATALIEAHKMMCKARTFTAILERELAAMVS